MKRYCPICGKKVVKPTKDKKKTTETTKFFPFCSERCKLVDLNSWFENEYIISGPLKQKQKDEPDELENVLK